MFDGSLHPNLTAGFPLRGQKINTKVLHRPAFDSSHPIQTKSLDEILAFDSRSLSDWADEQLHLSKTVLQKQERSQLKRSLDRVVNERKKMDTFLCFGRSLFNGDCRMTTFKRLCLLSREHFHKELRSEHGNLSAISDEEILLETFVKYAMQHNPYYQKVQANRVIYKNRGVVGRLGPRDFVVKWRDASNISCASGSRKLSCIQGKWAVFFAITYFIWHMKEHHLEFFKSSQRNNKLFNFLRALDIGK